ncbi:MAG: acetylornithine deacetylase [Candidatus Puniceispirillaceae bacterium]
MTSASIDILRDLIAFPTISRDSNLELIDYCATRLEDIGGAVEIIRDDSGTKANLFATIGPRDAGGVMLSGHTDVVPVDGQDWTKPPFAATEMDGRIYGRGTADMKGFVACALAAALATDGRHLTTPLHLAFSHDEEIGCVGVRSMIDMLDAAPVRPAMCVVGEPTGMKIATGHKGKTALLGTCSGRAAHSSLAPQGVNAIHLACDLVAAIRALQQEIIDSGPHDDAFDIPFTTLHAGRIDGGVLLNIVPEHASVTFEIRNLPEDQPERLINRLRDAVRPVITAAQAIAPEAGITLQVTNSYPGLSTSPDEEVVALFTELAGDDQRIKVAFGTEAGLFDSRLGVPTIVCGPGSMQQGHKPDEFIAIEQLAACDAMLARMTDRLVAGL